MQNIYSFGRCRRSVPCGVWVRRDAAVRLSKCQMNRARRAFLASKYEWVTGEGLLGRFAECTLSSLPLSSFLFFLRKRDFADRMMLEGAKQRPNDRWKMCASFRLKMKTGKESRQNQGLFSCGRVRTTVRTNDYGGTDASVRK